MESNASSNAKAAEVGSEEAFAKLSSPLTELIIRMAAAKDRATMASCKAVSKEWRDSARAASRRLVIKDVLVHGGPEMLQRALDINPCVNELEVLTGSWHLLERLRPLTLRAWSSITMFPNIGFESSVSTSFATQILSASSSSLQTLLLSELRLRDCSVLEPMISSLGRFTNLRKLTFFGNCHIEQTKFTRALREIAPMVSVRELSFDLPLRWQSLIWPNSISLLPTSFPNVRALAFPDHRGLSDSAFLDLFSLLPQLEKLDIKSVSVPHLDAILSRLAQHCTSLQQLTLGVPIPIDPESAHNYRESLHNNPTSIPAKGVLQLLIECPSLSVLELPNIPLMPHVAWPELLEQMGGIEVLQCSFDFHDIPSLAALRKLRTLELYRPEGYSIQVDDDLLFLASVVGRLPLFSKLILHYRSINEEVAQGIKSLLRGATFRLTRK